MRVVIKVSRGIQAEADTWEKVMTLGERWESDLVANLIVIQCKFEFSC